MNEHSNVTTVIYTLIGTSLSTVVGIAMKNYGFRNFRTFKNNPLQQALAEKTNLELVLLYLGCIFVKHSEKSDTGISIHSEF